MKKKIANLPTNYFGLIKASLQLYRASFDRTIILSFLFTLFIFIPNILAIITGTPLFIFTSFTVQQLWFLMVQLIGTALYVAILWRMHCVLRGIHELMTDDLKMGVEKVLYIIASIVVATLILFGVFLLVIGIHHWLQYNQFNLMSHPILLSVLFIWLGIIVLYICSLFIFFAPLIVTENYGVFTSLKRSASLVWNHWGRVITTQITPWVVYVLIMTLFRYLFKLDILMYGIYAIGFTFVHILVVTLLLPWLAALSLMQLKDLELRNK